MKILPRLCLLSFLTISPLVVMAQGGLPDTLAAGSENLILNGQGERTKLMFSLYDAGLYLDGKSDDANQIIEADEPMAIILEITSGLITSKKMEKAVREGFNKSTDGDISDIENEIESFIAVFQEPITEGNVYQMIYVPGTGMEISKDGASKNIISGLDFKKALFGIWFSDSPAQKSLKQAMLGG